ncbi:MAG TPA: hypothetical protein VJ801_11325 [Polyangia bacterium]|nr:hypothetical protein [Polyangia bacterium]
MSFFSRLMLVAWLVLAARPAFALNVLGVYRAACDRVMGVVVRVERRDVHLLTLSGELATIPRHEIVSLTYYPVPSLPVSNITLGASFPMFRVKALQGKQIVDLVEGWPIDYSEEKISFLQRDGKDLVINRDSIWSLEIVPSAAQQTVAAPAAGAFDYAHPQASGFCESAHSAEGRRQVFPQQFLNDEVVIKRELDRLQEGYEKVEKYSHDQLFYPVPEVYRNETSLGLWLSLGSRHGANDRRNNLTPLLTDELSFGPFGYQHVIMTGSAPNRLLIHEEPQTQIYYAFKAAYFHASVLFDPNLVLVGGKYAWRYSDFSNYDANDRWVESFLIELGFDIGNLSLQIVPVSVASVGMGGKVGYRKVDQNLWRIGPRFVHRRFQTDITVGTTPGEGDRFTYARANVDVPLSRRTTVGWSGIYRAVSGQENYDWFTTQYEGVARAYHSSTLVNAFRVRALLGRRAAVEANLSIERASGALDGAARAQTSWFGKGGICGSFRF